jgi:hypothetical protein
MNTRNLHFHLKGEDTEGPVCEGEKGVVLKEILGTKETVGNPTEHLRYKEFIHENSAYKHMEPMGLVMKFGEWLCKNRDH